MVHKLILLPLFLILLTGLVSAFINTTNLEIYYSFNTSTVSGGTITDLSGNSNDGTAVDSNITDFGKVGEGWNFTGTGDHVITGFEIDNDDNYTACMWLNTSSGSTNQYPFNTRTGYNGLGIYSTTHFNGCCNYATNKYCFFTYNSGCFEVNSTTEIQNGTWYYVCAVHTVNENKIYVNGNLEGTETAEIIQFSENIFIGSEEPKSLDYKGTMDEFTYFKRELNTTEILVLYNLDGNPLIVPTPIVIPPVNVTPANFTYKAFECDLTQTGKSIGYVTIMFLVLILWAYALVSRVPILNLVFGFVMVLFAWNIAKCFFLANVLFVVLGIFSMGISMVYAFQQKDKG